MRHKDVGIIIPWFDTEDKKHMTRFRFNGDVDRRRMRRMIRKYFTPMGIVMDNQLLNRFIKHRKYQLFEAPETQ